MSKEYLFTPKNTAGTLRCIRVDTAILDDRLARWREANPEPAVPLIEEETFEAVAAGRGFDLVANPDDPTYQAQLLDHSRQTYLIIEGFYLETGLKIESGEELAVLTAVLADGQEGGDRFSLFNFMTQLCRVTQEAVEIAERNFRLYLEKTTAARLAGSPRQRRYATPRMCLRGGGQRLQPGPLAG